MLTIEIVQTCTFIGLLSVASCATYPAKLGDSFLRVASSTYCFTDRIEFTSRPTIE